MVKSLSFLYRDSITETYLKKCTNYLAFTLDPKEIDRIKEKNITLLLSQNNGNTILKSPSETSLKKNYGHIAVIDKHIIEYCSFTFQECIATILHEIGHFLNQPDNPAEVEFYADYYASSLGFRKPMISSLRKIRDKKYHFASSGLIDEIEERIIRLTSD